MMAFDSTSGFSAAAPMAAVPTLLTAMEAARLPHTMINAMAMYFATVA